MREVRLIASFIGLVVALAALSFGLSIGLDELFQISFEPWEYRGALVVSIVGFCGGMVTIVLVGDEFSNSSVVAFVVGIITGALLFVTAWFILGAVVAGLIIGAGFAEIINSV